ncbi:hypothetical protein FDX05_20400 [Citrobacter sp. wls715]|nr:hypothetical protein FDX05_20400 [Citrobacter sp. wls715]
MQHVTRIIRISTQDAHNSQLNRLVLRAISIGAVNTLFPVGTIRICHLNTDVTHNKAKAR